MAYHKQKKTELKRLFLKAINKCYLKYSLMHLNQPFIYDMHWVLMVLLLIEEPTNAVCILLEAANTVLA